MSMRNSAEQAMAKRPFVVDIIVPAITLIEFFCLNV